MTQPLFASIQTDLTKVQKGDWFLPMTLKEINQHAFIAEALAKGAAGFTYEEGQQNSFSSDLLDNAHLSVPNLREYLFSLAQKKRPELNTQIAVIAGSAGKTSVKELVGAILKAWHPNHCFISPDNQNTKIALATQILRLPLDCQSATFEMGARRLNDFAIPLSYLQPSVVALLNVGSAHVGEFGSKENLWKEKLSCLATPFAKTLVVPADNLEILKYAEQTGKDILSFGSTKDSSVQVLSENSEQVTLLINNESMIFTCPFQSAAKGLNVAAAVAVALTLGASVSSIREGLAQFTGVPRRFQIFQWDQVTAIDDAFNASPESMKEGLQQLRKISTNKKVLLVLGSMLELGESTEQEHKQVAHVIKDLFGFSSTSSNEHISVATVGNEAQSIGHELISLGLSANKHRHFNSAVEAQDLKNCQSEFDLIYFKGSKSIQLQKIFGAS